jgi:hypothetical protein
MCIWRSAGSRAETDVTDRKIERNQGRRPLIRFTEKTEPAPTAPAKPRSHAFAVGASVMYRAPKDEEPAAYRVTRCLPEKAGMLQYRIKGETGGRERVADEADLMANAAAAASGRLAL